MDFNQVRYFLALANTLNFTEAAEKCHVTQPALTQAIRRLEEELGGELISRDGRNKQLTHLGQTLKQHFEHIENTRNLVKSTAKAFAEGNNTELNIGIMCTLGPKKIAGVIGAFQQTYPDISLIFHDVTPSCTSELLVTGALDGAFCGLPDKDFKGLQFFSLFEEEMGVAFHKGHPFSQLHQVPLEAVMREPFIERLHCECRQSLLQHCSKIKVEPNIVLRSEREDWIQGLIGEGVGVGIVPRFSIINQDILFRPLINPVIHRQIKFAIPQSTISNANLKLFVEFISHYPWKNLDQSPAA